jgi:hypothetical protein
MLPQRPNPVTVEELARDACLAWADGDNDKMQAALLGLFLHLYGRAPAIAKGKDSENAAP